MAGINYTVNEDEAKKKKEGSAPEEKEKTGNGPQHPGYPVSGGTKDENVITPEEFQKLEQKEQKKKLFGFLRKPKTLDASKLSPDEKAEKDKLDMAIEMLEKEKKGETPPALSGEDKDFLLMKVERIEGNIEGLKEQKALVDEKLSRMSEEIGEVRSSVLEREKLFSRIESEFAKLKQSLEQTRPETVVQTLEKYEQDSEKTKAELESLRFKMTEMEKATKSLRLIMDRIKDLDNLLQVAGDVKNALDNMEKERKDVSRLAAKTETIFSEMTEKMNEFSSYKSKIDFTHDSMHDILKTIDMLEVKMERLAKKDDVKKVSERLDRLEDEIDSRVRDFKYVTTTLLDSLKRAGLKTYLKGQGAKEMDEVRNKMKFVEKELRRVMQTIPPPRAPEAPGKKTGPKPSGQSVPAEQTSPGSARQISPQAGSAGHEYIETESRADRANKLLDSALEKTKAGNIREAMNDYLAAIGMYERIAPQKSDTTIALYNRIIKVYNDLSARSGAVS